jgi:hypothetical protein
MISGKCINNIQWKHWFVHINIQVSSSFLPSMQRPWRLTHCGRMKELSKTVGLQHKIFPHYGESNLITTRGAKYGRTNMTCPFRQNHVKLAWAFINLMNVVHHSKILHNLFKDNIILHFSLNKPNVMYISIYD